MLAHERNDFSECGGTIGVSDVATLGRVHDVAAAPKIMERVVDRDLADSVFVRHRDRFFHRGVSGRLAKLFVRVPNL